MKQPDDSAKSKLSPWVRGPFELVRHANGHLREATDTDRRIALIGFDNAVEVCIDVFLRLHPKLRNGVEIPRSEVDAALKNYHTKIEFLDRFVASHSIDMAVPFEAIVWYHQLRNELYHSGNGMVPETHVLEGAQEAALAVFQALFGVDLAPMLSLDVSPPRAVQDFIPFRPESEDLEFLRAFIELEQFLNSKTRDVGKRQSHLPIRDAWRKYVQLHPDMAHADGVIESAAQLRNKVVHGVVHEVDSDRYIEEFIRLSDLLVSLKSQ